MSKYTTFETGDFELLLQVYGTHSAVAKELNITPDHYGRIRRNLSASGPLGVLLVRVIAEAKIDSGPDKAA